jgi:hypothetical protein
VTFIPEDTVLYTASTGEPARVVYNYPLIIGGVIAIIFLLIIAWMGFIHLKRLNQSSGREQN